MVTGALNTGFTVLSAFTATRVYISEQFPTALRGRGHIFSESTVEEHARRGDGRDLRWLLRDLRRSALRF
jgi:hypothetical protein